MSRIEERHEAEIMSVIRAGILTMAEKSTYDHRDHMPEEIKLKFPHLLDPHQLLYSRLRLAVARFLAPKTIYEVGVGWGISGKAFLEGALGVQYYGIDTGEMGVRPYDAMIDARNILPENAEIETVSSADLPRFSHPKGPIDLIHLDGGHGREQKSSDVVKAVLSSAKWLLCDDAHDPMVAAGIFDGLYQCWKGTIPMIYFENSHSGSLLIHSGALAERKDW